MRRYILIIKCGFQVSIWQHICMIFIYFLPLQITQLKIDNNPFAKGFRDTGAGKREKK